jgi:hypothetical protein
MVRPQAESYTRRGHETNAVVEKFEQAIRDRDASRDQHTALRPHGLESRRMQGIVR